MALLKAGRGVGGLILYGGHNLTRKQGRSLAFGNSSKTIGSQVWLHQTRVVLHVCLIGSPHQVFDLNLRML